MTQEGKIVMRGTKISEIILSLCQMYGLTIQEATDIYYNSVTANLIEEGIADLQCRSNKYLAELIWEEYNETNPNFSSCKIPQLHEQ